MPHFKQHLPVGRRPVAAIYAIQLPTERPALEAAHKRKADIQRSAPAAPAHAFLDFAFHAISFILFCKRN